MSPVFENRQARRAHLRRTRQKIQIGSKDQRLFAHKGRRNRHRRLDCTQSRSPRVANPRLFPLLSSPLPRKHVV